MSSYAIEASFYSVRGETTGIWRPEELFVQGREFELIHLIAAMTGQTKKGSRYKSSFNVVPKAICPPPLFDKISHAEREDHLYHIYYILRMEDLKRFINEPLVYEVGSDTPVYARDRFTEETMAWLNEVVETKPGDFFVIWVSP